MNDLARIRALAGLKEASSAQVITPGNDFYPPGFIPPMTPSGSNTVQVPIGWDQKGGGGGGASSAGAQGSTGSGQPSSAADSPSILDKITDYAKSKTQPNPTDSEPVRDIKKYVKDIVDPPPPPPPPPEPETGPMKIFFHTLTPDEKAAHDKWNDEMEALHGKGARIDLPSFPRSPPPPPTTRAELDRIAKLAGIPPQEFPKGQAAEPGPTVIVDPTGWVPSTGDVNLPKASDKTKPYITGEPETNYNTNPVTVNPEQPKVEPPPEEKPQEKPPGNRPPPLDFSEPKQDMSKLPGQGGPGAENNPIVITPKKKEPEPEKTATPAPVVPVRPTPSQMFGGGIKPSKEEPPKQEEPKAEKPKIPAPSAAPVAVAPTPITTPKQEEPKAEKPKIPAPSAVPAPGPQVTFPAPTPRTQVPGPTAAPAPIGTTSGSGTSSSGSGSGSSTSQGSGQGSGQGLGSGSGSGSGQGQGSGSGSGTGGGIGDKWDDHHWFQYEVGGKPAMVAPNKLPPGWKHIGNGRYVSEKPRSAYGPNERPRDPDSDNRTHMERPDWSRQLQKESTEGLDEIRRLAGIKEQVPQPGLTQAFGSGISTSPAKEPVAQDDQKTSSVQAGNIIQPQSQKQQDWGLPGQGGPGAENNPIVVTPKKKSEPTEPAIQSTQSTADSPEYIKRYKSGNRQPPLIFQEPSYGGPIAGPGLRGPVYRGPNPYGAFGQGRR